MSATTNKIIINLDKTAETFGFKDDELLQQEEYQKFAETLEDLLAQKRRLDNPPNESSKSLLDEISECQVHDAIFISGERGSGKTTFLKSIEGYVKAHPTETTRRDEKKLFQFLPIIDPTLLHDNEKFLVITISHIVNFVEKNHLKCHENDNNNKIKLYKLIKEISESITTLNDKESIIERMIASQNSLQLEQKVHEFFKIVTKICGCEMLVLPIDDIDMAFSHGFEVLETVRKFLASPYIIPVVSGDPKLYGTIVEKQFSEKVYSKFTEESGFGDSSLLNINLDWSKEKLKNDNDDNKFFNDNKSMFNSNSDNNNHTLAGVDVISWKQEVRALSDRYFAKVFPTNQRIALPSIKYILRRYATNIDVKVSGVTIKLLDIQQAICNTFNAPMRWGVISPISNDYGYNPIPLDSLRSFTQYLTKMKEIIKNEDNFQGDGTFTAKATVIFFNNTRNFYANNYDKQFEYLSAESSSYEISNILYSDFFDPQINPHRKPIFEGIIKNRDRHFIQKDKCNNLLKKGGLIQIYIELFTYRDYYTSYQQRYFIVAGKFIEFLWLNLDGNFVDNIKSNRTFLYKDIIVAKMQYRANKRAAFLTIPKNNYFDNKEDNLKLEKNDNINFDEIETNSVFDDEVFDSLCKILINWKKKYFHCKSFITSVFIYKVTNKFMYNLDIMYNRSDIKWDKESMLSYIQRVCWIFLNSVAFFEQVNQNTPTSETNIAIGKNKPNKDSLNKSDNAYRNNIRPLIENRENSLTYAFYHHPLIYMILNKALPDGILSEQVDNVVNIQDRYNSFISEISELDSVNLGVQSTTPKKFDKLYNEIMNGKGDFEEAKGLIAKLNRVRPSSAKAKINYMEVFLDFFKRCKDKDAVTAYFKERLDAGKTTKKFIENPPDEYRDFIEKFKKILDL